MVSIGANPQSSISNEKEFPISSKWLSVSGGNLISIKKPKVYAHTLIRTD